MQLTRLIVTNIFSLLFLINLQAQGLSSEQLNEAAGKYALSSFPILKYILSIPNDAFYPGEIEKNILWCENEFGQRGFTSKRIPTETVPLLLGE